MPFEEMLPPLVPSSLFLHGQVASLQPSIFYINFLSLVMVTLVKIMDLMMTVMMIMNLMTKMMITGWMMTTMSCHQCFHMKLEKQALFVQNDDKTNL